MSKKGLKIAALPGYPEEIGRWLWGMEDVRRTLLNQVKDLTQQELDAKVDNHAWTIGSLLYHISLIEADWLYSEVLESELPEKLSDGFPLPHRDQEGKLSHIEGESLERHLERLEAVRHVFLKVFLSIDLNDWRRARILPDYEVTPEWVVYHLIEHEAHHRGQISSIIGKLREGATGSIRS